MKKYAFLLLVVSSAQALDLQVNGLGAESDSGTYRCSLFKGDLGFPGDRKTAVQSNDGSVKNKIGTCSFKNIEPGTYAVSTYHDENDNNKLDTNFFGAPKESYGFSNDASRSFSAPSFDEAAIEIKESKTIRIHLK